MQTQKVKKLYIKRAFSKFFTKWEIEEIEKSKDSPILQKIEELENLICSRSIERPIGKHFLKEIKISSEIKELLRK